MKRRSWFLGLCLDEVMEPHTSVYFIIFPVSQEANSFTHSHLQGAALFDYEQR